MRVRKFRSLALALGACSSALGTTDTPATPTPSGEPSVAPSPASPSGPAEGFPIEAFAGLGDEPVSDALAAELQEVLDESADGDGLTATLITPQGTWTGATGFAARDRAMVPNDQMSIAHITQTIVAAQVMQLVEAG